MMMLAPWRRSEPHSGSLLLGWALRDLAAASKRFAGSQDTMNKHQRISGTVFTVAKWVSRGFGGPFGQVSCCYPKLGSVT